MIKACINNSRDLVALSALKTILWVLDGKSAKMASRINTGFDGRSTDSSLAGRDEQLPW